MELNTKQVRAIVNNIAGFGAQYTDKTKEDKANTRRSVIWCFYSSMEANEAYDKVKATFAKMGVTNAVKRTGTPANMWQHTGGGEYVRVIAQIG